jgi:leader peptidase (prepilin peptidase)/N-methyltransferase
LSQTSTAVSVLNKQLLKQNKNSTITGLFLFTVMLPLAVMAIYWLIILGLCFGSFINALVWRLHQQSMPKKKRAAKDTDLSIVKGRSMCPNCKHALGLRDLIPVLSWLSSAGKCRYCGKPISWQYPIVELMTTGLFAASYVLWPFDLITVPDYMLFTSWLVTLVLLVALLVYDVKWMLLPNRLMVPLVGVSAVYAAIRIGLAENPLMALLGVIGGIAVASGLFYVLFQVSNGKWIGGGDVKLGIAIGLLVTSPVLAMLTLFIASITGLIVMLPGVIRGKVGMTTQLPFGPFLIAGTIVTVLYGQVILDWYLNVFLFA